MKITEDKINKTAKIKLIDNSFSKKNIFIISKIIDFISV